MNQRQQKILKAIYEGQCYLFELYEFFKAKRTYVQIDKDIQVLESLGYVKTHERNEAGLSIQFYTTNVGDMLASPVKI